MNFKNGSLKSLMASTQSNFHGCQLDRRPESGKPVLLRVTNNNKENCVFSFAQEKMSFKRPLVAQLNQKTNTIEFKCPSNRGVDVPRPRAQSSLLTMTSKDLNSLIVKRVTWEQRVSQQKMAKSHSFNFEQAKCPSTSQTTFYTAAPVHQTHQTHQTHKTLQTLQVFQKNVMRARPATSVAPGCGQMGRGLDNYMSQMTRPSHKYQKTPLLSDKMYSGKTGELLAQLQDLKAKVRASQFRL